MELLPGLGRSAHTFYLDSLLEAGLARSIENLDPKFDLEMNFIIWIIQVSKCGSFIMFSFVYSPLKKSDWCNTFPRKSLVELLPAFLWFHLVKWLLKGYVAYEGKCLFGIIFVSNLTIWHTS
jgi:hypothetical protein